MIQFIEPVPPFARFTLKSSSPWGWNTHPPREDDFRTIGETLGPSSLRTRYAQTVVLPPGAEVVSSDPMPKAQKNQQGRVVLNFEAEPIAGQQWKWTVKYRLEREP